MDVKRADESQTESRNLFKTRRLQEVGSRNESQNPFQTLHPFKIR